MQTERVYRQIDFLNLGDYQYIYQTTTATHKNDYLNCTSVYFYTDNGLSESILGDCFMILEHSIYDSETPITNDKKLSEREIIITYNLASRHNLEVGSKVYSKHNVKNILEEYTVVEILPVSYGVLRVDYNINYGAIFIGYDESYVNNTNYSYVGFSKEDPSILIQESGAGLISLELKETYNRELFEQASFWQGFIIFMVVVITLVFVIFHWRYQTNYYSKLTISGCPMNKIRKQILLDIAFPGVVGLLISVLASVLTLSIHNGYFSYLVSLSSAFSGLVTLMISALFISYKRRKL